MQLRATHALLGLLCWTVFDLSECLETVVVVQPDKGLTVMVSTELPLDQCAVCTVSGGNDTETSCHSSLSLVPEEKVKLLFNCSQPIVQAYTVTITQTIECTKDACSPATVSQPSIFPDFIRTVNWELKAPEKIVVSLNILGEGLMETSKPCPIGLHYSVTTSKTNSKGPTQYCQGGSETRLDLPSEAVVSLRIEPKAAANSLLFQAYAGPLKGRTMVITVDSSTTVAVTRPPSEPECEVCTVDGSTPDCSPTEKTLTNVEKLSLEFSCLKPEDMYTVKTKKKIECTKSVCTPAAGEVDPDLFKDFKRSLTWDISVPERTVLTLDFPGGGLKDSLGAGGCPDGISYSVRTTRKDGKIKTREYCKGGTVSDLDLPGATAVTVEVPKGGDLDPTVFNVKAAPRGARMIPVTPEPDTIITISRVTDEPDCSVCVNEGPKQNCKPTVLKLIDPRNTSVEFTCPQPQDFFSVEINREIDCTDSCPRDIVQAKSSMFPDFNRTFTWDLKEESFTQTFQINFPDPGMRQIPNEETCPDEQTYSLIAYIRPAPATIGTFCKGGTISNIQVRYKGRLTLQVPAHKELDPVDIKLTVGPLTSSIAIVRVNLPRGISDTDFITANYPSDFPDKQQMQWDFVAPDMHNYTMLLRDHTAPECLNDEVEVEYQKEGKKKATKLSLTDPQPQHQQGNFNMVLKNCETNQTLQGLTLKYSVSVMRSGHPVLCTVDLTKLKGVSLQIEKVGSDPYCEMSIDSKMEEKINVAAGSSAKLSFLDCPKEDLRLTASKVIECQNVKSCTESVLTVPKLDSCLRMPLHSFTWHIKGPQDGTVDLESPTGSFKQSLPGQECNNQSISLHVVESEGFPVGDFCYNGAIQKVQVHANVSVTVTARDFKKTRKDFLNVSFSEEIPETIIYRVNPKASTPTLLATPNWPRGMKPSSTVSWIVTVPSQYEADLQFVNISQPKCQDRHTSIKVKILGQEEEIMSRREDEEAEDKILVPESFYLNMSNCVTAEGDFGAVTKIVLQKKSYLLPIILGILGVLLLMAVVVAVVFFVKKKQKRDVMNKNNSIYIGKGNIFRPGDNHFPKSRADNDSHVYDSIDETMVYGHLLSGSSAYADSLPDNYNGVPVDSYQTFTGPKDGDLPVIMEPDNEPEMEGFNTFLAPSDSFLPPRPRTPIMDRQDSIGFHDRRMVDNELYTFKNTGDINNIRLSYIDTDPQPPVLEDSL